MLKVKKSFNNNLILATDSAGTEVILKGKGIGFHKQRGDVVDEHLVEATFRPENENESSRFLQLFSSIPDDYWTIAEELLVWARETQGLKLSQKVILPLCDHLAGAVERYRNGVRLKNPMLWDIQRLYHREYCTGMRALELVKEYFGVEMDENEAGFLAYHFVYDQLGGQEQKKDLSLMTTLLGEVVDIIQQSFQLTLDPGDYNTQRLFIHVRFLVQRILGFQQQQPEVDEDWYNQFAAKYPRSHRCVLHIAQHLEDYYHYHLGLDEQLYLLIHIAQVTRVNHRKN